MFGKVKSLENRIKKLEEQVVKLHENSTICVRDNKESFCYSGYYQSRYYRTIDQPVSEIVSNILDILNLNLKYKRGMPERKKINDSAVVVKAAELSPPIKWRKK